VEDHNQQGYLHRAEDDLVSPPTIVSIVTQILTSGLEEAGYKNASYVIRKWPKIVGVHTARLLMQIFEKRAEGKPITEKEHREIAEALQNDPKDAAALLGVLTANLVNGALDVKAERKAILDSYNVIFGLICAFMNTGPTSIALKGFVHDENCISYWNITGKEPQFSMINGNYLFPVSLDVYLFQEEPADARLVELNFQIRKAYDRRLTADVYDINRHEQVAKVDKVLETDIAIHQLDPDRATKPAREKDIFGTPQGLDYARPVEYRIPIPPRAEALIGLYKSLTLAKEVLGLVKPSVADTQKKALEGEERAS
jgi:hypothetical protein